MYVVPPLSPSTHFHYLLCTRRLLTQLHPTFCPIKNLFCKILNCDCHFSPCHLICVGGSDGRTLTGLQEKWKLHANYQRLHLWSRKYLKISCNMYMGQFPSNFRQSWKKINLLGEDAKSLWWRWRSCFFLGNWKGHAEREISLYKDIAEKKKC